MKCVDLLGGKATILTHYTEPGPSGGGAASFEELKFSAPSIEGRREESEKSHPSIVSKTEQVHSRNEVRHLALANDKISCSKDYKIGSAQLHN
ncbi:hypothetical protein J6590_074450 [Homalodisca vitripennis]|nr:hypothetical protein J6590_074450 [Homalodisca vitripennis]